MPSEPQIFRDGSVSGVTGRASLRYRAFLPTLFDWAGLPLASYPVPASLAPTVYGRLLRNGARIGLVYENDESVAAAHHDPNQGALDLALPAVAEVHLLVSGAREQMLSFSLSDILDGLGEDVRIGVVTLGQSNVKVLGDLIQLQAGELALRARISMNAVDRIRARLNLLGFSLGTQMAGWSARFTFSACRNFRSKV